MKFVCPNYGDQIEVKWVAHGHVQFAHRRGSCALADFEMFYGPDNRASLRRHFGA